MKTVNTRVRKMRQIDYIERSGRVRSGLPGLFYKAVDIASGVLMLITVMIMMECFMVLANSLLD